MSDRPTAVGALVAYNRGSFTTDISTDENLARGIVAALRAAAGCVPGQPLVILDNGELTTAAIDPHDVKLILDRFVTERPGKDPISDRTRAAIARLKETTQDA